MKLEQHIESAETALSVPNIEQALTAVAVGYSEFPDHPELLALEIRALRQDGRNDDALRRASQIPESGHRGSAIGALFDLYMDCGRIEQADELLSSIDQSLLQTPWAMQFRARILKERGNLAEAAVLLEKVCADSPGQVPTALELAKIRESLGKNSEARQGLLGALQPAGSPPVLLVELARMQIDAGEYGPALDNLRDAAEKGAPTEEARFLVARAEELNGNPSAALELAKEELQERPHDPRFLVLSWRCASLSVSPAEAAALCESYASLPDCTSEGLVESAEFLAGIGRWDLGLAALDRIAALDTDDSASPLKLTRRLIGKKDPKSAIPILKKAVSNAPESRSAAIALALCEADTDDLEAAIGRMKPLGADAEIIEFIIDCRLRLAELGEEQERHIVEALADAKDGRAEFPDHPGLIACEIKILRMTGQMDDALELAQSIPETARKGPVIGAIYDVFMDHGRLDLAETLLSGLPDEYRNTSWAMQFRARVLKEQGRLEEAESLLDEVCSEDPSQVPIILDLARIRTKRGKSAEAKRGLAKSLLPSGFAPAILIELARLQIENGEFEPASGNLKKAAESDEPANAIGFLTARIEELKGNDDRALELAHERLKEDPDDFALQALSWRCASRSVSPEEAEAMCEEFAARPDCSVDGLLEAARFMRSRERWDRSLAILESTALESADPAVARERAECLIGCNELKEASGLLEEILKDSPGDRDAELSLARCEAHLGDPAKALERLERLETLTGKDLASIVLKIECRLQLADKGLSAESHARKSLSDIEEAYFEFPDHPNLVALEIRALRKAGREEDALSRSENLPETSIRGPAVGALFELYMESDRLDRAEELLSTLPEGHLGTIWAKQFRARLLSARESYADAEPLLKEILAEDPGQVHAILELARLREKTGKASLAKQELTDALPVTGYPSALLFELTRMLIDDKEYGPAQELLRQAAEREGAQSAEIRFHAARIEELEENYDRALELAREGLREYPENILFETMTWRCVLATGPNDEAAALCETYAARPDCTVDGLIEAARFLKGMERWDAGLALLDRAAEMNPGNPFVAKERAECFIGRNDVLNASLTLREIVANEPGNRWASVALARCEAELGNVRSALDRLDSLGAEAGTEPEIYELMAECHLRLVDVSGEREEHAEKALSIVEEGYSAHPHHPNLIAVELRALKVAGRTDEALSRARKTPESSHSGPATGAIFNLYMDTGMLEDADDFVNILPETIQKTSWGTHFRARVLAEQGRSAEAETLLEESLVVFPEYAPSIVEAARIRAETGRVSEAKRRLVEIRDSTGLPRDALIELARLQVDDREYEDAEKNLAEATRDGGQTVESLHLAALLEERKGNIGRALDMARDGLRDNPGHLPFETMRWRCTSMSASQDEAESLCEAYAARPDCPAEGLLEAAKFMRILSCWDNCLALLDRVAEQDPDNTAVEIERAQCLIDRRDPIKASETLEELARKAPNNRWAEILLAQCSANLGDARSALDRLDRLEAKSGSNSAMIQIRAECLLMIGDIDAADVQMDLLRDANAETRAWAGARRADLALSRGMASEALAGIEKAVELDPDNMLLNQRRSLIRLLNGDFEGARHSNIAYVETRYASDVSRMLSRKERSSVHGRILNEFRLIGDDLPVAGYFAERNPDSALPELRRLIEGHEDNTPAAMAMLALMCRAGHVTETPPSAAPEAEPIPKRIFQFWDDLEPPEQVSWLMEQNARIAPDFEFRRFHKRSGAEYLREKGEEDAAESYRAAPNATAKSDILRLALLWYEGGIYLDVDDRIVGSLDDLMPPGMDLVGYQETYMCVANNFLAATAGHPVIRAALDMAVRAYIGHRSDELWLASGPGAVTRAIAHRGTTAEGGLIPGIWIMPSYRLRPVLATHVDLNYKATEAHWVKNLTDRRKS